MEIIDIVGGVAGALTSISYLPQLYKIWRTKSAGDISTVMFLGLYTGIGLWCWYAVILGATHMLIANSVTLILMTGILLLKYCYRNNTRKVVCSNSTPDSTALAESPPIKIYS